MNVFGFNIQRTAALASTMAALTAPAVDHDPGELESVKFGRRYQQGTSREMLDVLDANRKAAERNTRMALYLSIPHQALYLLSKVELRHTTPVEWAETIIALAMALVIPYLVDQLILMCIRTLAARAAANAAKWRSAGTLAVALPASMYVNFAAPGPLVLRLGAAGLIVLVGLYQVARSARPDFAKVGETERAMKAEVDSIAASAATKAPARQKSAAVIRRNGERARELATANPRMTVTELVRVSGVGRDRARRILDEVNLVNIPTSPIVGPVGTYTGAKA
jgi:hypothetical protein